MATRHRGKDAWTGLLQEWRDGGHPDDLVLADLVEGVLKKGVAGRRAPTRIAQNLAELRQELVLGLNAAIASTAALQAPTPNGPVELVVAPGTPLDELARRLGDLGVDLRIEGEAVVVEPAQPSLVISSPQDVDAFVRLLLEHQAQQMQQGYDPYADFFRDDDPLDALPDAEALVDQEPLPDLVPPEELAALEQALADQFGPATAPATAPKASTPAPPVPAPESALEPVSPVIEHQAPAQAPREAHASAPAFPEPSVGAQDGPLGQADLDALLAGMLSPSASATDCELSTSSEPEGANDSAGAELPAGVTVTAAEATSGPLGQADLDALLGELAASNPPPPSPEPVPDATVPDATVPEVAVSETVAVPPEGGETGPASVTAGASQSNDFEALLAELGSNASVSPLVDTQDLVIETTGPLAEGFEPEPPAAGSEVASEPVGLTVEAGGLDPNHQMLQRLDILLGWVAEAEAEEPEPQPVQALVTREDLPDVPARVYAQARCAPLRIDGDELVCLAVEPVIPAQAAALAWAIQRPLRLIESPESVVAARWAEVMDDPWDSPATPETPTTPPRGHRPNLRVVQGLAQGARGAVLSALSRLRKSA